MAQQQQCRQCLFLTDLSAADPAGHITAHEGDSHGSYAFSAARAAGEFNQAWARSGQW